MFLLYLFMQYVIIYLLLINYKSVKIESLIMQDIFSNFCTLYIFNLLKLLRNKAALNIIIFILIIVL